MTSSMFGPSWAVAAPRSANGDTERPLQREIPKRVLGLLALLSIITYLDRVCIAVAGPRMQDDLHISPEARRWVTGVFALS